jgi:hypothetical protein
VKNVRFLVQDFIDNKDPPLERQKNATLRGEADNILLFINYCNLILNGLIIRLSYPQNQ